METLIVIVFILGYAAIAFEHTININKTAPALLTGVLIWTIYALMGGDSHLTTNELLEHLSDIASILFFLLGAMTIVELIDSHNGFKIITEKIHHTDKRKLLWIIGIITFFMSSVLDNLTTTIVIVSLLRKLIKSHDDRLFFVGIVIIAANAGGAWTPIGDVTTTMLWIGGQITAMNIITRLFLPSLTSLVVPLSLLSFVLKGHVERPDNVATDETLHISSLQQKIVFYGGILGLLSVPVFKSVTHLPPYMGMMLALSILWFITEIMHKERPEKERNQFSITAALKRIDTSGILFFLGILTAVAGLQAVGTLPALAKWLSTNLPNESVIVISIGLLSAIVDNVPLVAATQGMYSLAQYPTDHFFWEFLAYCAGTGGSILVIGSAAGVAAMGMEKIDFFWYAKKISWIALVGYFAGVAVYLGEYYLFHAF